MEVWGFRGDLEIWWPSSSCSGAWFCEWIKESGHFYLFIYFYFLVLGREMTLKKKTIWGMERRQGAMNRESILDDGHHWWVDWI